MIAEPTYSAHFIGIGGIGMSGIAEILLQLGWRISGSDLNRGAKVERLIGLGARIEIGHRAEHLGSPEVVVVSSAVAGDNPELRAARQRGLVVISRAEMLAELMRTRSGLAVAGSHGKTTTASLIAAVTAEAGLDPTVIIGGRVNSIGGNARLGRGVYLVAEADESDGSFLSLCPTSCVVTNIEPEHLDHYGDLEALRAAFAGFVDKIPFHGVAVLCSDCANVRALLPGMRKRYVTYGQRPEADYRLDQVVLEGGRSRFRPIVRGVAQASVELSVVGQHNLLNALAALAFAEHLGISGDVVRCGLQRFSGVDRRFTVVGEVAGVTVVDDYAHHPTEIRATLAAARRAYTRRVVAVFQPHRHTRARDLADEFASAFGDAALVVVTPIYAAGQAAIPGVSGRWMADLIAAQHEGEVLHHTSIDDVVAAIRQRLQPGDMVITLGAGDVWRVGTQLLAELRG